MLKLLVVIPAYNEADNIERVVNNLITNYPEYDYLVVNDGSKDDTAKICRNNGFELLDLPNNLGLTGAVQAGMRYAFQHDYDAVLQFDGDGQHRPEFIKGMLDTMEQEKINVVIGSRFVTQKKPHSLRMLGNNLISLLIKISTGQKINDPTSGMRIYSREVMEEFSRNINYAPEPDTISYLIKCGMKVKEIQVEMDERVAGESYLTLARSMKYMTLQCFSIIFIQAFRRRIK